jgi:hypothetical protein
MLEHLINVFRRRMTKKARRDIAFAKKQVLIQNAYDVSALQSAKKIVVFVIPPKIDVYGGLMSFFSLCEKSREALGDSALTIVATCPWHYLGQVLTHSENKRFPNNERIYRFEQLTEHADHVRELILHIPEIYAKDFYGKCTKQDLAFIQGIPDVHINILLQNIDLMPPLETLSALYSLTDKLTLTTAHSRYATQEVANKWGVPLKHVSVHIDISQFPTIPFDQKENLIVFSRDDHPAKELIGNIIQESLPEYDIVTVRNMSFYEYMALISRARFSITFGEGFDGYFVQPYGVGSMGLSVYNDRFFPDASYKTMRTVYASYEEMAITLKDDVRFWETHPDAYTEFVAASKKRFDAIFINDDVLNNFKKFYMGDYDFYPNKP